MALREEFERSGNWLFRNRSYLPFLVLPLVLAAFGSSDFIEDHFGEPGEAIWTAFCAALSLSGFMIRVFTVGYVPEGTSGRNTKGQLAEYLNTDGLYSITRHPLYLGNFLIFLGLILVVGVWWFAFSLVLLFWIYYERIMYAEEQFLSRKFGSSYEAWSARTPAFIPDLGKWRRPARHISMKMVLKREYTTLMGLVAGFMGLVYFHEAITEKEWGVDYLWVALLGVMGLVYLILRHLRKHTKILTIRG